MTFPELRAKSQAPRAQRFWRYVFRVLRYAIKTTENQKGWREAEFF
jgi:hypothetical protein